MPKIISNAIPVTGLPNGWFMIKSVRTGGRTLGKVDTSYFSPTLKVFRSRVGVLRYITAQNNLPPLPAEVVAAPVFPAVPAAVVVAPDVAPVAVPIAPPVIAPVAAPIAPPVIALVAVPGVFMQIYKQHFENLHEDESEDESEVVIVIDSSSDDSEDDEASTVIDSSSEEEIEL